MDDKIPKWTSTWDGPLRSSLLKFYGQQGTRENSVIELGGESMASLVLDRLTYSSFVLDDNGRI